MSLKTHFNRSIPSSLRVPILTGILIVVVLGISCVFLWEHGIFPKLFQASEVSKSAIELGHIGPISIVVLMMVAVITGLFPGAVVALAAGAIYGHTWGTIFVVIGVELGAILAFTIARGVGHLTIQRWLGNQRPSARFGSDFMMLGIVILSRPLAFLSLDGVSYVAGLSKLGIWQFTIAALMGNIPLAFLMGHFGKEWGVVQDFSKVMMITLILMAVMIVIDVPKWFKNLRNKNTASLGT